MSTIICVPKSVCSEVEGFLKNSTPVIDAGENEVLLSVSTEVGGPRSGLEVDIKVVNGDCGPYIDAILFEHGSEVCVLEPSFETLCGEYVFEIDQEKIVVEIVEA